MTYPQVAGLASRGAEAGVNSTLARNISLEVSSFIRKVQLATPAGHAPTASLTGGFTTTLLTSRVASFRLRLTQQSPTGPTPSSFVASMTFDLLNGHRYRLNDMFGPGTNYLFPLAQLATPIVKAKLGPRADQKLINQGLSPNNAANYASWGLDRTGLELTFQPGQVAPPGMGWPTITIPYKQLAPFAAPGGPILNR
ncbi:MAG: RsiV family protein [Acidimicrobiales bacterium]